MNHTQLKNSDLGEVNLRINDIRSSSRSNKSKDKKNRSNLTFYQSSISSISHPEDSDISDDSVEDVYNSSTNRRPIGNIGFDIQQLGNHSLDSDQWEILEGLRSGQSCVELPNRFCGFLFKSRKWPMKGWNKRYFVLENGIMTYAKNSTELDRGKVHATIDIGLSVVTYKRKARRFEVDADDLVYHLKAKSSASFEEWLHQLRHHRLHRQHEVNYGSNIVSINDQDGYIGDNDITKHLVAIDDHFSGGNENAPWLMSPVVENMLSNVGSVKERYGRSSFKNRSLKTDGSQNQLVAWLIDSKGFDQWNKELSISKNRIFELESILSKLTMTNSCTVINSFTSINELQNPSLKKDKVRKYLLRNNAKKDRKNKDRLSTPEMLTNFHLSSSNPNLLSLAIDTNANRDTFASKDMIGVTKEAHSIKETVSKDFLLSDSALHLQYLEQAKLVHESLKNLSHQLVTDRERLKIALQADNANADIINLRQTLQEVLKQNADLKIRMKRIHKESSLESYQPSTTPGDQNFNLTLINPAKDVDTTLIEDNDELSSLANSTSLESHEFYDAAEKFDSSITDSEDGQDVDEDEASDTDNNTNLNDSGRVIKFQPGRRTKLTSPRLQVDLSLWGLLRKNIGKDLSKVCMPVSLNEPLNALQRLCEELEYSELVDRADTMDCPVDRLIYLSAFVVSGYASTLTRAGQKPFNPILGETYECVRMDRDWRFIAEQVSHHPPIAACHCESSHFEFWQDMQVKTKFWGKSMEILPSGLVHLKLRKHEDYYTWNKATSCVHNILGGEKWVDHYGEVLVNSHTHNLTAKLTFVQSSYWSSKRHEVHGTILKPDGTVACHLFGKWSEAIYCGDSTSTRCIWRPGVMPDDCEMYYGFTRFAIELNEIEDSQKFFYPPTDSRFRPDQRLLEHGQIAEAKKKKVPTATLR